MTAPGAALGTVLPARVSSVALGAVTYPFRVIAAERRPVLGSAGRLTFYAGSRRG